MSREQRVCASLPRTVIESLDRIAKVERRSRAEVIRVILQVGVSRYRWRRSLLCAGPGRCTRAGCDHTSHVGTVVQFPCDEVGKPCIEILAATDEPNGTSS